VTRQALVIGYGNTLRGDDAVGQVVARALAGEAAIEGVEVIACHQLMPELAECIDAADMLLFITAKLYGRTPDAFVVRVGAGSFELGEGLSAAVAGVLPDVVATVRQLVLEQPGTQARTESSMVPSASSN
jgi:hypothetical protein